MYDLDAAFITAYELFACQNDPGTIGPMLERSVELAGKKPGIVWGDSAYAGGPDLALCEQLGVTVYAPVSENDFSEAKPKKNRTSWTNFALAWRLAKRRSFTSYGVRPLNSVTPT